MRFTTFLQQGRPRLGVVDGDAVIDLNAALPEVPADLRVALESGVDLVAQARAALASGAPRVAMQGLRHAPLVPEPGKTICLGLNYRDHAREAGLKAPAEPIFFAKWANSLIGPTDTIVPPAITDQVDYEVELAVVIGRRGRDIAREDALAHVAGAMVFNDVSARDLQLANQLWTGGKAIDTFGPCGPHLVLLDEIDDLQALGLRTRVNGETVQDGTTGDMIFGVA